MAQSSEEFDRWVRSEDWYQIVELGDGRTTPGKVDSRARYRFFEGLDLAGKRVLDIGCNSGAYCLWAKRHGAREVVGVDILEKRLDQARRLAEFEGLEISFLRRGISELGDLGVFDVVFCFAVLTEIPDLLGSIQTLRGVCREVALVELSLAKPVVYLSRSPRWLKGFQGISRQKAVLELRKHKHGWMIDPTLEIVALLFGEQFRVRSLGPGPRYEMLRVDRDPR